VPYEALLKKMGRKDKAFSAGINDKGHIFILSDIKNRVRTFLLTPVGRGGG